jgi:Family of unknown function (DUF6492)
MQPLVALTYPGHFLLTALTIQTYFQHHPLVPVIVIVDDLSVHCWPNYIKDCEELYQCQIIPISTIRPANLFAHGWVRQQIAKLYLDYVLPYDTWFFTDGDIEYCKPAPQNVIPYVITRGGLIQEKQNAYVSKLLDISNPGIWTEHKDMDWEHGTCQHQVCVSNPPFRTMNTHTLQQLRYHIEKLHKKTIEELHISVTDLNNLNYSISEWELIANFQIHVLNEIFELVYYPTVPIGDLNGSHYAYCGTCFTTDSAFNQSWWKEKNIAIDDRTWNNVINISK